MLERVDRGELDFALIQGGYDIKRFTHVQQVASLPVQPLHLLVKPQYHEAVIRDFGALRGKTINLGNGNQTATYWLCREVIAFAGLKPTDYRAATMTWDQIQAEDDRERLPDAVLIVTRPPSEMVKSLVQRFGYRLVPLPFGAAFRASARLTQRPVPAEGLPVRNENFPDAAIPAYAYSVSPPIPPEAITTIGAHALLITHERTSDRVVFQVIDELLASRYAQTIQPPLTADIVRQAAEAPWHAGALEYRRQIEPLITGEVIGVLSNTLQLLLPFGGGLLLACGWIRNRILINRERRIDRFIALVSGVEQRALRLGQEGGDRRKVAELHRELSTIKDAALERIAGGEAGNPLLVVDIVRTYRRRPRLPELPWSGTTPVPAGALRAPQAARASGEPGGSLSTFPSRLEGHDGSLLGVGARELLESR